MPCSSGPKMSKQGMVLSSSVQTGAPKTHCFPPLSSGIDAMFTCKLISNAGLRCYRCKNGATPCSASPLMMTITSCTTSAEGFWIALEFKTNSIVHLCTTAFYKLQVVLIVKKVNNQCIMQHIGHDRQGAQCAKIKVAVCVQQCPPHLL